LLEVNEPPVINLNDTLIEGCEDLTVSFTNRTPGNYTYEWSFGNGETSSQSNPTNVYTEPGLFNVGLRVLSPEGCESVSNANVEVRVKNAPDAEIFASPTSTDIENPIIGFSGNFGDATNWTWYFGDGNESSDTNNFNYTYADTGTYRVKILETNAVGCSDSAFVNIRINPNFDIKIPNVFTPNTGGKTDGRYNPNNPDNSIFFPFVEYVEDYHMMIFNRWGELVFESKDINIGWDGYYKNSLAQGDVYIYKIEVTFINGQRVKKVGDLTLLR
jgi:gliding motility-associated-like protein